MARPRSDIAPRIVHAARKRFLREGVDGASLRRIAADARTSIGMVYYYFPSKDELFFAVVEETYVTLLQDLATAIAPDASVGDRLRRLYRRIGGMNETEADTVRLVIREALVSSTRLDRLIQRFSTGHIPLVLGLVADGQREGALNAGLHPGLALMATLALGGVPQFMRRAAEGRFPLDGLPTGEAFADALAQVLLDGIGARAAGSGLRESGRVAGR